MFCNMIQIKKGFIFEHFVCFGLSTPCFLFCSCWFLVSSKEQPFCLFWFLPSVFCCCCLFSTQCLKKFFFSVKQRATFCVFWTFHSVFLICMSCFFQCQTKAINKVIMMEISIVLQLQSSRFIPQQLWCININHMHNIQVGEGGIEGVERERACRICLWQRNCTGNLEALRTAVFSNCGDQERKKEEGERERERERW